MLSLVLSSNRALQACAWVVVASGAAISVVALLNKAHGSSLVGGTGRAAIGADYGASLRDPNELALLLVICFSFSLALTTSSKRRLHIGHGLIASAMALIAIGATQSRGGFIGASVVALFFGFRHVNREAWL